MTMRTYDINQYALKLRRSGKLLREIGEELGVSSSRAKSRVIFGTRFLKKFLSVEKMPKQWVTYLCHINQWPQ
jgi:predicted DNA-binding transcriptional regulator